MLLMFPPISFKALRKHRLNLLFKTTRESGAANGSLVLYEIETTAKSPTHGAKSQKRIHICAPPKRRESFCPRLTKTYQGIRITGQVPLRGTLH
jgi:hypothetical protein